MSIYKTQINPNPQFLKFKTGFEVLSLPFLNLFVIYFLFFGISQAQDTLNSKNVEERSYKLYTDKNWNELIAFGNKAVAQGIDYYYLRLRMGVAYYEKQNFRSAQKQFRKAYQFNSSEDVLMEYLYYCYVFNAQYDQATRLSKKISVALAEKLKTNDRPVIDYVMLEGGVKTTDKSDLSQASYGQFGLGHRIAKYVSFFHAVSFFQQKSTQSNLDQKQYYLSSNIPISKSWQISPAFHLVNRSLTFNPPPPLPPWPPHPPQPLPPPPSVKNYYVGSLSVKKSISKFDVGVCATTSNIDSITQMQGNISLSYFPFGNNKLFISSDGYIQNESISKDYKYAFSGSITGSPFAKLTFSGGYFYNQAHHISEMNGYIVNNSGDLTTSRITFVASYRMNTHVSFYMLGQIENKTQNDQKTKITTNYSYNSVFAGLKLIL